MTENFTTSNNEENQAKSKIANDLLAKTKSKLINEDNYELVQKLSEHSVHQVHKCCQGIRQSKGHHQKLIMPIPVVEHYLVHILISDPQLMVTKLQVNLEKHVGSL